MPTREDHLATAERNLVFAEQVKANGNFLEWAVTALFYAAVHYGRAFISAKGGPAMTSHRGFETHFVRIGGDQGLYATYRELKDESERARYDCVQYTSAEMGRIENLVSVWREEILKQI